MATEEQKCQKIQAPCSEISTIVRTCKNPLVISMTVSHYKPYFPSLAGPAKDCHLVAFSMNYKRGYTLIYYDNKNVLNQIGRSSDNSTETYDSFTLQHDPNFKLKWKTGEIKQFNDKILKNLSQRNEEIIKKNDSKEDSNDESKENSNETKKQVKYDALIYFISGRGSSNGVFYDSDGNKLNLNDVFFNRFSNKNCPYFYGKPKLFIVDCSRGKMTSKKKINEKYCGIAVNVRTNDKDKTVVDVDDKNGAQKSENSTTSTLKAATQKAGKPTKLEKDYDNLNDGDKQRHDRDDMRCIFGNPDMYRVNDSTNGGYLTRSLMIQLCTNKNINEKASFDKLLKQSDALMNKLVGNVSAQVIEDINHWEYDLKLQSKLPV